MEKKKKKKHIWIYWIILFGLYVGSLYLLGYEQFKNPSEPFWIMITNLVLISLPLILLFGPIGLILTALDQKRTEGKIGLRLSRVLFYAPRIAGILMITVSLFTLDVFGDNETFQQQFPGLVRHAAPSIILTILVISALRKPVIGFIIFGLAAIVFMTLSSSHGLVAGNFIIFVAPLAIISALFWINWKWKDDMTLGNKSTKF